MQLKQFLKSKLTQIYASTNLRFYDADPNHNMATTLGLGSAL